MSHFHYDGSPNVLCSLSECPAVSGLESTPESTPAANSTANYPTSRAVIRRPDGWLSIVDHTSIYAEAAVFGQVARILLQAGENERALAVFKALLTTPAADLKPAWFRLDPNFAPLRSNPGFQRMVMEYEEFCVIPQVIAAEAAEPNAIVEMTGAQGAAR